MRPTLRPAFALVLLAALRAEAVIDKVEFACRPSSSGPVILHAGGRTSPVVYGFGVDLATKVEEPGLTGVSARVAARRGGVGSNVTLDVDVSSSARHGDTGKLRLVYPLGQDELPVKVVGGIRVTSMSVDGVEPRNGRFILDLNRDYTLVVRGSDLDRLDVTRPLGDDVTFRIASKSESEARLTFRSGTRRGYTLEARDLSRGDCAAPRTSGSATAPLFFGFEPNAGGGGAPVGGAPPTGGGVRVGGGGSTEKPDLEPLPFARFFNGTITTDFCNGLAAVQTRVSRQPDLTFGVRNNSRVATTNTFVVRLVGADGRTLREETVRGLEAFQLREFTFARPENRICVQKGAGAGDTVCRRCGLDGSQQIPIWDDRGIKVIVDATGQVDEATEGPSNEAAIR